MRLLDVLAANQESARLAVLHRDARSEKTASTKEATPAEALDAFKKMLSGGISSVKSFFGKSPAQLAADTARKEIAKRLQVLQVTSKLNPGSAALKADPAYADLFEMAAPGPGGKSVLHQEVETLKNISQGLDATKKPGSSARAIAMMGLGAAAGAASLGRLQEMHRHSANLKLILDDPSIPASHKQRAENAFKILSNYAPSIANDPIFSKDFVRNLVRFDMIDHKIVSDLIQAEKNYLESRGRKAQFLGSMRDTAMGVLLGTGG